MRVNDGEGVWYVGGGLVVVGDDGVDTEDV